MEMGQVILVSTPIGNLQDISLRAINTLKQSTYIAAEDGRNLMKLLQLLEISTQSKVLISLHEYSPQASIDKVLSLCQSGENVLVVSDAGSPMISDPAYNLVAQSIQQGVRVTTIPGASAPIAALELAGFPTQPFHFYGFVPRQNNKRKELWSKIKNCEGTVILFESPKRIRELGDELMLELPLYKVAFVREITKIYEEVIFRDAENWAKQRENIPLKGEYVVLLHLGKNESSRNLIDFDELKIQAEMVLESKNKNKKIAQLIGGIVGQSSQEVFKKLFEQG